MTEINLGLPAVSGSHGVPTTDQELHAKDFKSDQDIRWCPGCGDYAVLAAVQGFLPELGLRRENIVFISGIGCSSRFPYYLNSYGMHSLHGRAPAIATGLAVTRPDLSVWVVTGDGERAVHRRQSPDPRPAPQRQLHDPAVQQPGLRPDQGSVFADLGAGQDHQVDPDGLDRLPVRPGVTGSGRGGDIRRQGAGLRPPGPHRGAARRRPASGQRAGRDLPGLPGLQRRQLRRAA